MNKHRHSGFLFFAAILLFPNTRSNAGLSIAIQQHRGSRKNAYDYLSNSSFSHSPLTEFGSEKQHYGTQDKFFKSQQHSCKFTFFFFLLLTFSIRVIKQIEHYTKIENKPKDIHDFLNKIFHNPVNLLLLGEKILKYRHRERQHQN